MPYIGKQLVRGQNRKLDDISSGFNGSQTTFTLQVASQNVTVGSALQLWISLGGVIQEPTIDYTIAGNQITFTTAPAASLDFFGVIQGDVTDTNTPGDATVTTSKLATGLTVNLTDGSAATSSLQLGGTDSGLFSSAADKVNVTTGGAERLEIGDSEVVFNDPSNDVDFRVESNGNTHMLFVDAGNDRVGIGSSSPSFPLTVQSDSGTNSIAVLGRSADDISSTLFYENDGTTQIGRLQARQSYFQISGTDNTKGIFIDNAGEVGIGTSSPAGNLHISGSGDRSLLITGGTSGTTSLQMGDSADADVGAILYDNSNNSMQFKTNTSERMRIDSSGRLLVGTSSSSEDCSTVFEGSSSSAAGIVHLSRSSGVNNGSTLGALSFSDNAQNDYAQIKAAADATPSGSSYPGRLLFLTTQNSSTSLTERMRITNDGGCDHFNTNADPGLQIANSQGAGAAYQALQVRHSSTGFDTGTVSFLVFTNGNAQNTNNSYGSISDVKLKENIVDASSQWEDLKAVQVRNYNFKESSGHQTHTQIGVVAQEVETVSPGLVYETPDKDDDGTDLGTVTKSVNYSVLYMKAVKALQEAMDRIETLEIKVAALEAE